MKAVLRHSAVLFTRHRVVDGWQVMTHWAHSDPGELRARLASNPFRRVLIAAFVAGIVYLLLVRLAWWGMARAVELGHLTPNKAFFSTITGLVLGIQVVLALLFANRFGQIITGERLRDLDVTPGGRQSYFDAFAVSLAAGLLAAFLCWRCLWVLYSDVPRFFFPEQGTAGSLRELAGAYTDSPVFAIGNVLLAVWSNFYLLLKSATMGMLYLFPVFLVIAFERTVFARLAMLGAVLVPYYLALYFFERILYGRLYGMIMRNLFEPFDDAAVRYVLGDFRVLLVVGLTFLLVGVVRWRFLRRGADSGEAA